MIAYHHATIGGHNIQAGYEAFGMRGTSAKRLNLDAAFLDVVGLLREMPGVLDDPLANHLAWLVRAGIDDKVHVPSSNRNLCMPRVRGQGETSASHPNLAG